MTNHLRTLLLNLDGPHLRGELGEEFVPASFRAKTLPPYLQAVWSAVFGSDPDRVYRNFRLREILALLHTTELEEYVLALDNRITYLPFNGEFFADVFRHTVLPLDGTTGVCTAMPRPVADDRRGRMVQRWNVLVLSGDRVRITPEVPNNLSLTITDLVYTAGTTNAVPLPGSQSSIRLSGDITAGSTWQITSVGQPQHRLLDVHSRLVVGIGAGFLEDLFGRTLVPPYDTFANLWHRHPHWPYQMGGLLLALAYRLHELP